MVPPGEGGLLSTPPSRSVRSKSWYSKRILLVAVVLFVFWFFKPTGPSIQWSASSHQYPAAHPQGAHEIIKTSLRFIYPAIEDVPALQGLGIYTLFSRVGADLVSLNHFDEKDPVEQKTKEETQNAALPDNKIKNDFKNRRKYVYDSTSSSNSPRVVIVSAINYEKYKLQSLVNLIQNRVDYAIKYDYGVYVRWTQEFVAEMNDYEFYTDQEKSKWARLFCLRAAMFAFPHAEWFWFLDEDSLIMNRDVDIAEYLLNPASLDGAMMRSHPLIPPTGIIKSYESTKAEDVELVLTQSRQKIETGSFVLKNTLIAKGILDTWLDKLFLQYNNFPFGPDSAITHILQWHPYFLSKLALVPARMISSLHNPLVPEEERETDPISYFSGDLVAQWIECNSPDSCESILANYVSLLQEP